jgi:hypothetical protein
MTPRQKGAHLESRRIEYMAIISGTVIALACMDQKILRSESVLGKQMKISMRER